MKIHQSKIQKIIEINKYKKINQERVIFYSKLYSYFFLILIYRKFKSNLKSKMKFSCVLRRIKFRRKFIYKTLKLYKDRY